MYQYCFYQLYLNMNNTLCYHAIKRFRVTSNEFGRRGLINFIGNHVWFISLNARRFSERKYKVLVTNFLDKLSTIIPYDKSIFPVERENFETIYMAFPVKENIFSL